MGLSTGLIDCGNGVRLERGVKCRLSDGTTLLSDHYYPDGEGPWPTLLMRQPYGRDIASTVVYAHPVGFARHGYHVAIQDVRGRGGSEGRSIRSATRAAMARRRLPGCGSMRRRTDVLACMDSLIKVRRSCLRQRNSQRGSSALRRT